jgi:hypothetical protein
MQHVEAQVLRPAGGILDLRSRPCVVQTHTEPEVLDHAPDRKQPIAMFGGRH